MCKYAVKTSYLCCILDLFVKLIFPPYLARPSVLETLLGLVFQALSSMDIGCIQLFSIKEIEDFTGNNNYAIRGAWCHMVSKEYSTWCNCKATCVDYSLTQMGSSDWLFTSVFMSKHYGHSLMVYMNEQ
jgi:hypothetical protein